MTYSTDYLKAHNLDLLPRVARNYADWSLREDVYAKHLIERLGDNGISKPDVWNFLEYIAVVSANGITYLGIDASGFRDFKKSSVRGQYREFAGKTMDYILSDIVRNFHAHARNDDSFYSLVGKEALDRSLRNFFVIFPYLYDNREFAYDDTGKPDPIVLEEMAEERQLTHRRQRETFGVSELDVVRFDLFLSKVLGHGFKVFAEITNSHPADLEYTDWQKLLVSISDNFFAYNRGDISCIDPAIIDVFIERFPSFWD